MASSNHAALALFTDGMVGHVLDSWPPHVQRAFTDYLGLPDHERSLRLLSTIYAASDDPPTKALGTLQDWSATYGWNQLLKATLRARNEAASIEAQTKMHVGTNQAADTLLELLGAEKGMMSPTGEMMVMPDNAIRLKAAQDLLDRAGLGATQKSLHQHVGDEGGPIRMVAKVDVSDMSTQDLIEHLTAKALHQG